MVKILIADDVQEECYQILKKSGLEADFKPTLSPSEMLQVISEYSGLIVRSKIKVTRAVIEAGKQLKIIGRAGIGTDNIDVEAATRRGIVVVNAPMSNIRAAAEHTFGLLLASARNISKADSSLKGGAWNRNLFVGVELEGKTLGIVGLGKVGALVAKYGQSFSMRVISYDPHISKDRALELGVELVKFDELLKLSDFVTIHVPLVESTKSMFSGNEFANMKKTARLINTSRGGIIDENALSEALSKNEIAGACLDVFETEPLPANSPLRSQNNIILTPHLGASTEEAQLKVAVDIANEFISFFKSGIAKSAVNIATIQDPSLVPFIDLAFSLGNILSQITTGRVKSVDVSYKGYVAKGDTRAITNSCINGILKPICHYEVNIVNAMICADERKISVAENKVSDGSGYKNLLRVVVTTDALVSHSLSGTVFEDKEPRIVEIDGNPIDVRPSENMLVMFYPDVPGVVGKFGTVLGKHGINIESMAVGRSERGKRAAIIVTLDDPVPDVVTEELKSAISGIEEIKRVTLLSV